MKRPIVALIVLISLTLASVAAAAVAPGRIVVMISVDGLAGYYFDDPKAQMPNIRALAADGARAESMKASVPTVTWPNHTTLVTGDHPARHGVVGNNYYDRATGKNVQLISDPVLDKDKIIHVPTVYDLAHEQRLVSAAVRWPATRNAHSIDFCVPELNNVDELNAITSPELIELFKKENIKYYSTEQKDANHVDQDLIDQYATPSFLAILREKKPNVALLHLVHVDHTQHAKGPKSPEAYQAIKDADAMIGQVWDELKKNYAGSATLFVVSDHGFSPIEHAVLPNVVLRNAGLIDVKGTRISGGSVHLVIQGGCAMVYILDNANRVSIAGKVEKAFTGVDGIDRIVSPEHTKEYGVADPKVDPNAPDMLLFAKEGWTFGDTAAGAMTFVDKPERAGTHGHDPNLPDLHATFVAWGEGIAKGMNVGPIENIVVAPTIAKLLGIEMKNTDGNALTAALAK
jgi:predicted AlkP superfamily pyrophosphatase or phosphodiesterase